jgi:rhodanese-related sulfurtransferase
MIIMTPLIISKVEPAELRRWLHDGKELAVVDARTQFDFGGKNLFFASSLPLAEIELRAADLLPRRDVRIVVADRAEEVAVRAAERLRGFGFSNVHVLRGGIDAWERSGFATYSGVHVPSKAFAEVVEETLHTPWIEAADLQARQARGENIALFDSRSWPEYQRATIPGAVSLPGAEIVKHVRDLVPDPETLVVVACGGRTRSIIGAQALINAALPNKVVSVKNGAMAWRLAGFQVQEGATDRAGPVSTDSLKWGAEAANGVAAKHGVQTVDRATLARWRADASRSLYLLDVRTPEEYAAGHLPGSVPAQGGQLVQETDSYVAVRNARVVLVDDAALVRANITASWLVQFPPFEVFVLQDGLANDALEVGAYRPRVLGLQGAGELAEISDAELAQLLAAGKAEIVDLDPSPDYRRGHIPGAWFGLRVGLAEKLPSNRVIVLTSADGLVARLAAAELARDSKRAVQVLRGGTDAWRRAGRPIAQGLERVLDHANEVWLPPAQRDGDIEAAMREYLDWEIDLARAIERDPDVRFALRSGHEPPIAARA